MGAIASQITSLTIVYSTVYSDADQRKHQSSVSLAFVRGIHRNSPHKWPVTWKMFPFDEVIMKPLNLIYGYPILKWDAVTWFEDRAQYLIVPVMATRRHGLFRAVQRVDRHTGKLSICTTCAQPVKYARGLGNHCMEHTEGYLRWDEMSWEEMTGHETRWWDKMGWDGMTYERTWDWVMQWDDMRGHETDEMRHTNNMRWKWDAER